MNIDKNLLETMAGLDDATLVASIRAIAAASGVDLTGATWMRSAPLCAARRMRILRMPRTF